MKVVGIFSNLHRTLCTFCTIYTYPPHFLYVLGNDLYVPSERTVPNECTILGLFQNCTFVLHCTFICKHHVAAVFHHVTATLIWPQRTPRTPCTQKTYLNSVGLVYDLYDFYGFYVLNVHRVLAVLSVLYVRFCTFLYVLYVLYVCPNVRLVGLKRSVEWTCYVLLYSLFPFSEVL